VFVAPPIVRSYTKPFLEFVDARGAGPPAGAKGAGAVTGVGAFERGAGPPAGAKGAGAVTGVGAFERGAGPPPTGACERGAGARNGAMLICGIGG